MDTFDLIQAGLLLKYEVQRIEDTSAWVADILDEDAKGWFRITSSNRSMYDKFISLNDDMLALYPRSRWPVLIEVPTGRGKNWFTIKCLARYAAMRSRRVLLLTNRTALTKQQRLEVAEEYHFPNYGQDVYDRCHI